MINPQMQLFNNLADIRKAKGISRDELADMVGVRPITITAIEKNKYIPNAYVCLALCLHLDCSFHDIFYFDDMNVYACPEVCKECDNLVSNENGFYCIQLHRSMNMCGRVALLDDGDNLYS